MLLKYGGKIKNKVLGQFKNILQRGDLFYKKIKNRTPDSVKGFFAKFVFPYVAILLICGFVLTLSYAHAAAADITFIPNNQVMDLSPLVVANVVNNVSAYTLVAEDAVSVALAMNNEDFLGKPIITDTAQTVIAAPTVAPDKRVATTNYTVESGDTLSTIGWKFGLKIATIKITNNLSSETIKPGQVLKLPPGDISPDAIKKATTKKVAGAQTVKRNPGSSNNAYPYGWCTYWVATKRYVPGQWGNAKSWLSSARSAGYATGSEPAVGAIMVSSESWMGHVAYVESVNGGSITISEMNYRGWGVSDTRTISAHAGQIMGYVY